MRYAVLPSPCGRVGTWRASCMDPGAADIARRKEGASGCRVESGTCFDVNIDIRSVKGQRSCLWPVEWNATLAFDGRVCKSPGGGFACRQPVRKIAMVSDRLLLRSPWRPVWIKAAHPQPEFLTIMLSPTLSQYYVLLKYISISTYPLYKEIHVEPVYQDGWYRRGSARRYV